MEILLYLVLALALMGDVLLAVLLVRSNRPQKQADTADDFVRAMTPVLQSETDLLAEQLRASLPGLTIEVFDSDPTCWGGAAAEE